MVGDPEVVRVMNTMKRLDDPAVQEALKRKREEEEPESPTRYMLPPAAPLFNEKKDTKKSKAKKKTLQERRTPYKPPLKLKMPKENKKRKKQEETGQKTLDAYCVPLTRLKKVPKPDPVKSLKGILKKSKTGKKTKKVAFGILVGYKYWRWIECIKEEGLEGGITRLVEEEEVRKRDTPFTRKRMVQKLQQRERHLWRKQSTKPRRMKILQHVLETLAKVN